MPTGWGIKTIYGIGGIAYGVKESGFSYFLLLFYSQVVGVNPALVGTALMIALVVDAVLDPSIGQASDNLRSRWGRRHPFFYAAAIPICISYYYLWNPPQGWSPTALFYYLVAMAIAVRVFVSAYEIPNGALMAELTSDYDQRTSFLSYRVLFGFSGAVVAILCAYTFFLQPDANHPVGQLNPVGYSRYAVMASAIMLLSILVSAIGTHRYIPLLRKPPERTSISLRQLAREAFQTLSNRSFLMLLGVGILNAVSTGMSSALDIYFNTYFWQFTSNQLAILILCATVGPVIGPLMAPRLAKRLGKKRGYIVLACCALVIGVFPTVLRLTEVLTAKSPILLPLLCVATALMATLATASVVMIAAMGVDIVEESEIETGRRSEGLFGATNAFMQKCVTGIGIFAAGQLLALAQFRTGAVPDPEAFQAAKTLTLIFLPVQISLFVGAMLFASRYRITREGHEANLLELAARRERAGVDVHPH